MRLSRNIRAGVSVLALAAGIVSAGSLVFAAEKAKVVKIQVAASGEVLIDGEKAVPGMLQEKLAALSKASGEVWYYREKSEGPPPASALEIVQVVTQYELPLSLSTKPDFSDYVDEKGKVRKRK